MNLQYKVSRTPHTNNILNFQILNSHSLLRIEPRKLVSRTQDSNHCINKQVFDGVIVWSLSFIIMKKKLFLLSKKLNYRQYFYIKYNII